MSLPSLLRVGSSRAEHNAFAFEHRMAHSALLGGMPNISGLSVLPYFIAQTDFRRPQSLLNHQQAHNDATMNLPTFFAGDIPGVGTPPQNAPLTPNLRDNTGAFQWWLFANHQSHLYASETLPWTLGPYPSV